MDDRYAEDMLEILHSINSKLSFFEKIFKQDKKKKTIKLKTKKKGK